MSKAIKWIVFIGAGLIVITAAVLILAPMFVDIQQYKPQIEQKVSEATGRPFTLDGDLQLSLFPWAGLSFSDLHLGNPPGFEQKDLLFVKSFDVKVKLFPLIFKDIQVKRFVLKGARIALERTKDGRASWEGIGKPAPSKEKLASPEKEPPEKFSLKALVVGEFTITEGSVIWIDHSKGVRKEVSDVTLRLQDVSLDRPIQLAFSARLDEKPVSLKGSVGPVGKDLAKGTVPLDISVNALKEVDMDVKGRIINPAAGPRFDLAVSVSSFSPRKLVAALDQAFPVITADPDVLNRVAFNANLKGDPRNISISEGTLDLDESRMNFFIKAGDFSRPDVTFDLNIDTIDLDRYLPPPGKKEADDEKKTSRVEAPEKKKIDYTPLRRVVLNGTMKVGAIKVGNARIQNLNLKVTGKKGIFQLDPVTLKLYEGNVSAKGMLNVRKETPKSNIELQANGIQAGPLLQDILDKDILKGTANAEVSLHMAGDDAQRIKKSLTGKGDFLFKNGAIKGIDLPGMVRNVKAAFGLAEKVEEKPRTDFSELHVPFTITNGVVKTSGTTLKSPLLRVMTAGEANLIHETLDFKVEPKFVATLKGQEDIMDYTGITVPVLVTGTFSSPKFRPDLEGILKKGLEGEIPEPSELKEILEDRSKLKEKTKALEEKAKELIKGLPFGR
jgi:AsmA protein